MKKIFIFLVILFLPLKTFSWTPEFAIENKKSGDIIFENIGISEQKVLKMKKNGTIFYYIDFYKIFGKISLDEYHILKNYIFTDSSLNKNLYKNFDYDWLYSRYVDEFYIFYFYELTFLFIIFILIFVFIYRKIKNNLGKKISG